MLEVAGQRDEWVDGRRVRERDSCGWKVGTSGARAARMKIKVVGKEGMFGRMVNDLEFNLTDSAESEPLKKPFQRIQMMGQFW